MAINILTDAVASQIAAGEVVERPVSVIKELVENGLDAGASRIDIRIEQAGKRLLEVADDGCGISENELTLAVARHATSKLSSAEDLFHIQTLGFRGEALASIASVSRFLLTSRVAKSETGAILRVDAGQVGEVKAVGAPRGTVVRVENLFYNVPARLKFLKTDATERQVIDALVMRYALAYPHVRFSLTHDGRLVLQTHGNGDRREILAHLYGVDLAKQMLEVELVEDDFSVKGFISPVALTRSNRRELTFFVNGRWVHDIALNTALLQAYHTLLMVGRYPIAVLFLCLPPEDIDVNVHPAKAEVRFRSQDRVFSGVQRAASRTLRAYSPVPSFSRTTWMSNQPLSGQNSDSLRIIDPAWALAHPGDVQQQPGQITSEESNQTETYSPSISGESEPQSGWIEGQLPLLRLVGQIGGIYIVAEGPDGLYLIDQHAAHERVLYDKMSHLLQKSAPGQKLLEPILLDLPDAQAQLLIPQLGLLNQLGFEMDMFGPHTFRINSIPVVLGDADPITAVRVVVEDFEEDETPLQAEREARMVARICKRSAVKAGRVLSMEEQRALLRDLEASSSPRTCPHGRPTMIHLSVDLLARQFGRRGSR